MIVQNHQIHRDNYPHLERIVGGEKMDAAKRIRGREWPSL